MPDVSGNDLLWIIAFWTWSGYKWTGSEIKSHAVIETNLIAKWYLICDVSHLFTWTYFLTNGPNRY